MMRRSGWFALVALFIACVGVHAQERRDPGEDVEGRERWFWGERSFPFGQRPSASMSRLQRSLLDYLTHSSLGIRAGNAPLGGAWRSIGPTGIWQNQIVSGRVASILPAAIVGGPMYVGTSSGGVWRSADNGLTWMPLTDTQCSLTTGAMARDPSNAAIVYSATGDASGGGALGCGVLRSIDGGDSWTTGVAGLDDPNFISLYTTFRNLVVDPASAGTARTVLIGATSSVGAGIVRSTDAGASWSVVHNTGPINGLIAHPSRAGTYYAGDAVTTPISARGVYRSTDAGATWAALPALPVTDPSTIGHIAFAVSRVAPTLLWALVGNRTTGGFLGLFRYDESTNAWTNLGAAGVSANFGNQQSYDLVVAVDPRDIARVFVAGVAAFRSTDGGATFQSWASSVHVDWHALVFDPKNPDVMWAGTDGGVYVSADAGGSWTSRNTGLVTTLFYPGISVNPQGTRILGGSQDNGTQAYSGTPFWDYFSGGDGGFTAINYRDLGVEWGETQWTVGATTPNIFRRDATGLVQVRSSGINSNDRANRIPPLVMDPVNPAKLYFGTYRLYRTTDEGLHWTAISGDLSTGGPGSISSIGVAPTDTNTIYVCTNDGRALVSRDGGVTFVAASGLPQRTLTRVSPHPTDPMRALITVSGFGTAHVFETTDAFATAVKDIGGNLIDAPAHVAVYVPEAGAIVVGTDVGVFQTTDGVAWSPGPTGLPNVIVQDLVYRPAIGLLVAGTFGRGMFAYNVGVSVAVLRGDANGDGTIDAFDALLIQQTLAGSAPQGTTVYPRGDANCNGNIDAADLLLVLRAAVGLPNAGGCVGTKR
ncbi:MAG: dockerin type I domain-containing protein [bacterium]